MDCDIWFTDYGNRMDCVKFDGWEFVYPTAAIWCLFSDYRWGIIKSIGAPCFNAQEI